MDTFILHIAGASFEQSDAPVSQSNTYTYTNYLGIEGIGAYAPVMQTEWVCVAERAKDKALAALNVLSQATTWIFAILGILAVLFALLLSRSISRPVLALQRGARELKAGNLGYRVDLKRRDELGDLARSFNAMAESLRQSHEQLAQHGRELEETVSLRTTELRQANTRLEELNASLATSNKELQDFAYVASHDLREPLRKISAFGELLSESLRGRLDADEQENLGFMVDGASRMQAMIDALLTYSRVTTQASPSERVDLNHLLRDLRSLELAACIEETGGSVLTPEPLPVVHGDPLQMRQLFQNLIGNALKFHRDGVRPEVTIVAEPSDDAMVRIGVTDNGIGIAPEHAEQVFAMFKRLHSRSRYERDRNRSRRLQEDS